MRKVLVTIGIVSALCLGWMSISTASGTWNGDGGGSSELSPMDAWYLRQAQHTNAFEIAAGQLALTKSSNPDVQAYAAQMVADHTAQSAKVAALAARKFVPIENAPSPVQLWVLERLAEARGAEFDRLYITSQVGGHQEAIALTSKEANYGSDWEIRSLAQAALPVLHHHLVEAQAIAAQVGAPA